MRKNTLSFRLIRHIVLFCAALFVICFGVYYSVARKNLRQSTRQNAIQLADNTVGRMEQILRPAEKIPENIAWMLESGLIPKDSALSVLTSVVRSNANIYGAMIAFEPGFFPDKGRYYAPAAFMNGDSAIRTSVLGDQSYEYFYMDWYQIPGMSHISYWSEPYYDEGGGNSLMTTYSVPFYTWEEGQKKFAGVVKVDLSLEWLTRMVSEVRILKTGYAYVLSRSGVFVTHPEQRYIMNQSIFSVAEELGRPELRDMGRAMLAGESLMIPGSNPEGEKIWTWITPIPSSKWSLAVVLPHREMYSSLREMNLILLLIVVAGLFLLSLYSIRVIEMLTRPLTQFAASARLIASGQFHTPLPEVTTQDEMKELHDSFAFMQKDLATYIEHLKETTSAKEKIESELRIAREIQMGMIPHIFPPFPDLPQLGLYAMLKSAKEVGGDLYDFFMAGNKLCFAIGDVSGKGVPASLFMAVTRTLLLSVADKEHSPANIIRSLNRSLTTSNDSSMFVTFFLGMMDIETGQIDYANAGHNPPVILSPDGTISWLPRTQNPPIGLFEDADYAEATFAIRPGDKLFLYTDGVTEAENASRELFGEKRLSQELSRCSRQTPKELVSTLETTLAGHVLDWPQSDDITMMCMSLNE